MAPPACKRHSKASVAWGLRSSLSPSQAQGSGTRGRPASVRWIRRLASRASDGEMQADMVSLFFGQVEHAASSVLFDAFSGARNVCGQGAGQHEPPVTGRMFALVVVRDPGNAGKP